MHQRPRNGFFCGPLGVLRSSQTIAYFGRVPHAWCTWRCPWPLGVTQLTQIYFPGRPGNSRPARFEMLLGPLLLGSLPCHRVRQFLTRNPCRKSGWRLGGNGSEAPLKILQLNQAVLNPLEIGRQTCYDSVGSSNLRRHTLGQKIVVIYECSVGR